MKTPLATTTAALAMTLAAFSATSPSALAATTTTINAAHTHPATTQPAARRGIRVLRVCTKRAITVHCGTLTLSASGKAAPDNITPNPGCDSGSFFHFYFIDVGGYYADICYGGKGNIDLYGTEFLGFCGGNNNGNIQGYNADGYWEQQNYGPGSTIYSFNNAKYGGYMSVWLLTISGWGGSQNCPNP